MPRSRSRRERPAKPKTHDQLLRAELRRQRARRGDLARRRVGIAYLVVGVVLFGSSLVARLGGPLLLGFDTHHNIAQFSGLGFMIMGAIRVAGG